MEPISVSRAQPLAEPIQGWFYTIQPHGDLVVSLWALIDLGLIVGLLAGFFGVGGGFLMTPLLNLIANVPYNVAVGTDLSQMVGTATIANLRQRGFGYVDYKLAMLMLLGSVIGVESGAQLLEFLKYRGAIFLGGYRLELVQLVMTSIYTILLGWIGLLLYREASAVLRARTTWAAPPPPAASPIVSRLRSINLPPMISLPVSGVESISIWLIVAVGWVAGLLTGLLGVSGGFLRMPALIYVLGIPTVVSIGTNLFELLVVALYGSLTHSFKGNVELVLVVILLISSTIGSQLGAALQRKFAGPRLQQIFAGVIVVIIFLMLLKLVS
ncbi:MAG: sulfite exporter TauE/SafE family protein [Desulfobacteraceae bacterium]